MRFTTFKDLLANIEHVREVYTGTEEELLMEEVYVGYTFSSSPHLHVAIAKSNWPIAYVSNKYIEEKQ